MKAACRIGFVFGVWVLVYSGIAYAQHDHGGSASSSFFEDFFKLYIPRKICMFHEAPVIWLHVISDALIAVAYYSIPFALFYFARRRRDIAFGPVYWLFALFILTCGTTHAIGVLDIWFPFYKIDGVAKLLTAVFSVATAAALWPLMPKALAMASPAQLEETVQRRTSDLSAANDALRMREEQLRLRGAALEAAANGVVITDKGGSIVWVNRAFTSLTGYEAEEVVGQTPGLLKSGEHDKEFYDELWSTIQSGQVWQGEVTNRRKDGLLYSEEMSITPVRAGDDDQITHFVAIKQNITERKQAEEALRKSEEQLSAFFENTAVGASQIDREGRFVSVNRQFCQLTGYARGELLGRSLFDLSHPEDKDRDRDYFERCMTEESSVYDIEKRYVRKDGRIIWVHTAAALLRDENGKPWRSAAVTLDITERRRAEEEVRASERRFRELADSMPQIVWAARPDGVFDYFNRRWYELTEAKEGSADEGSWLAVMHPSDRSRCMELWELSARTGSSFQIEYRFKFPAVGEYRWHLGRALPVRDEAGAIERWYGTCTDIHDLKAAQEALHESDERFRLALRSSNTGWWHWDFEQDLLDGDEQVKALLGVPADHSLSFGKLLEQASAEDRAAIERRMAELRTTSGDYEVEFRTDWPDKTSHWILLRGRSLSNETSSPTRAMGIAIDISERKRLEHELQAAITSAVRAKEAAEHANSAKDQFLAVLSHELRTPLAPVLAAATLIERTASNDLIREPLAIIRRNVQLEARLIDDLLDLTRIVRGKIALDRSSVDVANVLTQVLEVCRPDIDARKVHVAMRADDAPYRVYGDNSRLQQIFWNLLGNAVKFTAEGGSIDICCAREGRHAVIEVVDNGIGIDPADLDRIFDAFEQADQRITRQFGGLGLGLAITKRLVEMHGGTISARSEGRGKGAVFRVVLPLSTEDQISEQGQRIYEGESSQAVKRILLVEDHGDTAQVMRVLLEKQGYEVATAGDAENALALIDAQPFDLLISDLGLPDKNGIELMLEVRRRGSSLKGIALSGFGREDDLRRSKEAGFTEHLTKPVDFDALIGAIERAAKGG